MVFKPTKSFHATGMRTEPPVSDPIAPTAKSQAIDATAPEEDSPTAAAASLIHTGVAVTGFRPKPLEASYDICVLSRQTKPCAVAFAKTSASFASTRLVKRAEPASVGYSALSNESFQLIGTPSNGNLNLPVFARCCAASASARAQAFCRHKFGLYLHAHSSAGDRLR